MLCKLGIASMAELLDLHGVWTPELLALMIAVAIDLEADDTSRMFGSTAAAVSLLGGPKGAHAFESGIAKTKMAAQAAMRVARGLPPEAVVRPKPGQTPADQFMENMAKIGIFPRRKRAKVTKPQETRKHKSNG